MIWRLSLRDRVVARDDVATPVRGVFRVDSEYVPFTSIFKCNKCALRWLSNDDILEANAESLWDNLEQR